jgi:photosystem II stability/assembly factor-like uncharacterized protein
MRLTIFIAFVIVSCLSAFSQGISDNLIGKQFEGVTSDSIQVNVSVGWNLISLPLEIPGGSRSTLFPNAISDAFEYNGSYQPKDTLEFGKAYWLKFAVPETITVVGKGTAICSVAVQSGWNMIGTTSLPISSSLLKTNPMGIISSELFLYNTDSGIYQTTTMLEPGKGYWVKVSQSGTLVQNCWGGPSEVLRTPVNESRSLSAPRLSWLRSQCGASYHLQIARDTLFQSILVDTSITDTSFQAHFNCVDTVYNWRVGIDVQDSLTIWSDGRKFTWTFYQDEQITPTEGGGTTLTPPLLWHAVSCAPNYHLQISGDSSFNVLQFDSLLSDTTYQCSELDSAQTYYWRVGIGGEEPNLWSRKKSFTAAWRYLGLGNEAITALAVDWSNSDVMYAGSSSNFSAGTVGGIFKSTNGGASWDTLIRGMTARDLDIHTTDPNIIYATAGINVLTPTGIVKSTDAGAHWEWADSGIYRSWEEGPGVLVIDQHYPETLYTGTGGPMGGAIYKSTNGGNYWFRVSPNTGGLISSTMSLAINPTNSNIVYAGTDQDGNVYKTTDGGSTWNETGLKNKGMIYDIAINPLSPETLFVGSWAFGLYMSTDGGATWFRYDSNFNIIHGFVYRIIVDTTNSGRIICFASGGVYKERINNYWERIGIDTYGAAGALILQRNTLYAGLHGVHRYLK